MQAQLTNYSKVTRKALEKLFNPHAKAVAPNLRELRHIFDECGGAYKQSGNNTHFARKGHSVTIGGRDKDHKCALREIKKMLADLNPHTMD